MVTGIRLMDQQDCCDQVMEAMGRIEFRLQLLEASVRDQNPLLDGVLRHTRGVGPANDCGGVLSRKCGARGVVVTGKAARPV